MIIAQVSCGFVKSKTQIEITKNRNATICKVTLTAPFMIYKILLGLYKILFLHKKEAVKKEYQFF